jgi:hypothetical protein
VTRTNIRRWEWKGDQQRKNENTTTTDTESQNENKQSEKHLTQHLDDSSLPLEIGPATYDLLR